MRGSVLRAYANLFVDRPRRIQVGSKVAQGKIQPTLKRLSDVGRRNLAQARERALRLSDLPRLCLVAERARKAAACSKAQAGGRARALLFGR